MDRVGRVPGPAVGVVEKEAHPLGDPSGFPSRVRYGCAVPSRAAPDSAEHPPVELAQEALGEDFSSRQVSRPHGPQPGGMDARLLNLKELGAGREARHEVRRLRGGERKFRDGRHCGGGPDLSDIECALAEACAAVGSWDAASSAKVLSGDPRGTMK